MRTINPIYHHSDQMLSQEMEWILSAKEDPKNFAPLYEKYHEQIFRDRKSTRLNSSHVRISYAVFCLKKKKKKKKSKGRRTKNQKQTTNNTFKRNNSTQQTVNRTQYTPKQHRAYSPISHRSLLTIAQ